MSDATILRADNLSVILRDKKIVDNISLEVVENDFIVIIGPNGAGKSTLLRTLLGVQKPSQGEVFRRPGLTVGYMPQALSINANIPMTVKYFLSLNRNCKTAALARITADTGIEKLLENQLNTLSVGQFQKVLLARALIDEPQLLVLDEPSTAMDISGELSMYKLLNEIHRSRPISILMVSQNLHLVMASAKRVICLYHHICCTGKPQQIVQDPEFVAIFGDGMEKQLALYQHNHDHIHTDS